jgi:hypothetical protein
MKKIIILALALILLLIGASFLLIPSKLEISEVRQVHCISKSLNDCFNKKDFLIRWWPHPATDTTKRTNDYSLDGCNYRPGRGSMSSTEITIECDGKKMDSRVLFLPLPNDSTTVQWISVVETSSNPITRFKLYMAALKLKKQMAKLLDEVANFSEKTINIYGFNIERTTFSDSLLLVTRFETIEQPGTETIYSHIDDLKNHLRKMNANYKDQPMVHVKTIEGSGFQTMIGLPIDHSISETSDFLLRRMPIMKDRFLFTEVKGGPGSIRNAHTAIEAYMEDHMLGAPAIPFEILLTDRRAIPDTSKWVTRVVYPSM